MGIAHRDLKPGNILLDANWRVKIVTHSIKKLQTDFATARIGDLAGDKLIKTAKQLGIYKEDSKTFAITKS
jgi:serine/threonine protein kinase